MRIFPRLLMVCLLLLPFTVKAQNKDGQNEINPVAALHAQTLSRISSLNQQIKTVDNATLRIYLRLKIADFIWRKKVLEGQSSADNIVLEAVEDFQKNKTEIPDFYKNSFEADIQSLLRLYSPAAYKKISQDFGFKKENALSSYGLMDGYDEAGIFKAVEDVKKRLLTNDSTNITAITFIIKELSSKNKTAEVNSVLDTIITSHERAIIYNPKLLFFLNQEFTAKTTPINLQKRHLNLTLTNGQRLLQKLNSGVADRGNYQDIYYSLKNNLLEIERLLPSEFPQAIAILNALQEKQSQEKKKTEEIQERIKQSKDKLEQTISEAKQAESKETKNSLWQQAAELALEEKKYQLSVDCLNKIETDSSNFSLWSDQFLDDELAKSALEDNDVESAELAISEIKSKLRNATALLQVVKHHHRNKETIQSQIILAEAIKRIKATENDAQKVRGLYEALRTAFVVDNMQTYEIGQYIVKTVNLLPSPNLEDKPDSEAKKTFVGNVQMVVVANIVPAFQIIAKQDPLIARNLANDLPRNYRIAALLAVEIASASTYLNAKPASVEKIIVKN